MAILQLLAEELEDAENVGANMSFLSVRKGCLNVEVVEEATLLEVVSVSNICRQ